LFGEEGIALLAAQLLFRYGFKIDVESLVLFGETAATARTHRLSQAVRQAASTADKHFRLRVAGPRKFACRHGKTPDESILSVNKDYTDRRIIPDFMDEGIPRSARQVNPWELRLFTREAAQIAGKPVLFMPHYLLLLIS
jgi:hypothetical protein